MPPRRRPRRRSTHSSPRLRAGRRSAFAAMRKLPPGHMLALGRTGARRIARYWRLTYGGRPRGADEEERTRRSASDCSRRRACACAATCRSARSCPAASIRAPSSRRWRAAVGSGADVLGRLRRRRPSTRPRTRARSPTLLGTEHHEFRLEPDAMDVLPAARLALRRAVRRPSALPTLLPRRARAPARHGRAERRRRRRELRRLRALRAAARPPPVGSRAGRAGPAWLQRALDHRASRPASRARLAWAARTLALTAPRALRRSARLRDADRARALYTPEFRAHVGGRGRARPRSSPARSRATPRGDASSMRPPAERST